GRRGRRPRQRSGGHGRGAGRSAAGDRRRGGRIPRPSVARRRPPRPPRPAPAALGRSPAAAGVGELAGQDVTAYTYRDRFGHRLTVYTGQQPFATPAEADEYGGDGGWVTRVGGGSVLCGR